MKKRRIDPQQKIDMVIRAARKLFVEKGFRGVAIPEIVKESGVSVGAIYLHFGNKEKLAESVYEKTLERFMTLFYERLSAKEMIRDKLQAFAELIFEITEEDSAMMGYLLSIHKEVSSNQLKPLCASEAFVEMQQIIEDGMTAGEIKEGDCLLALIAYTGVILRAVDLRLQGIISQPLQDISTELINNAWTSIAA